MCEKTWRSTYWEGVDEEHDKEDEDEDDQGADDVPLVVAPDDVLQGLEWTCKPHEGSFWPPAKYTFVFQ